MFALKALRVFSPATTNVYLRSKQAFSVTMSRMQHAEVQHGETAAPFRPETSMAKTLMDIGTRRIFLEEHDLFRQNVRRFFQEEVVPYHTQWEKAGEVSREVWKKAGEHGLLGIYTPEEHGGIGGDLLSAAIVWEEQMYCNCSGPGFSLHSEIVMPYISHYGSKAQIEHYIPQMTAGKCIGNFLSHVLSFRAFADSRVQPIYGGTNEIMKELISRNIVSKK
ncbi:long-chain specific acyl-CoA dehydrogenase, mitochondrial-like [Sinocyclocheilus grahami]|uniref:long-chain specific acyl-CoA dehydrogenase, mitochondrial-like n=1 Tax=Sinocyclocheilus grahami TaxID=75366 RepID=UPI0007AD1B33|nr:PREDICTED: long-chain specific acyl-CoA dehydrogenase, mitochondrial-like [Sinocyclocheilus grahami]